MACNNFGNGSTSIVGWLHREVSCLWFVCSVLDLCSDLSPLKSRLSYEILCQLEQDWGVGDDGANCFGLDT